MASSFPAHMNLNTALNDIESEDRESIASDESEELTEADEDEFERRRAQCQMDMRELEAQFYRLKDELIKEKQLLVDQKLKEIEDETAEEFAVPLQKLQLNMDNKIKQATLIRDYRLKNFEHTCEYEEMSTKQSLQNDKLMLFEREMQRIENEIKQIEESRRQFLVDYEIHQLNENGSIQAAVDSSLDMNAGSSTTGDYTADLAPKKVKRKKSQLNGVGLGTAASLASPSPLTLAGGPFIVYSLPDYDILEDWSVIKMHANLSKSTNFSIPSRS